MAADPVSIALVGAGRMGQVHLQALRDAEGIELAGVVEPVAPARERLAADGIPVWPDVDALLTSRRPDAVLIAAPSDQHPGLIANCARAGLPILCEKPVGVGADQAREAVRTARAAGVLLQVGYWRRFVPELRDLRARILAGALGDIVHVACHQWDHEPPAPAFRARSGGIVVDMGVHEFDQARWLLGGEVQWLQAVAAGPEGQASAPVDPDNAVILARMSGGAAVSVTLGRRFSLEDSCWVEVWGTGGYERVAFMWGDAGERVFLDSMVRQAEGFARAVRGAPVEGASGDDAIAVLTIAEQASRSLVACASPGPES